MYVYQNGDRCPCCGQEIKDMTERELELFSQLCNVAGLGMPDIPELEIQDIDTGILKPPDAGIYPPIKPVNPKI